MSDSLHHREHRGLSLTQRPMFIGLGPVGRIRTGLASTARNTGDAATWVYQREKD